MMQCKIACYHGHTDNVASRRDISSRRLQLRVARILRYFICLVVEAAIDISLIESLDDLL